MKPHLRLHFSRFVDHHYWPDWVATEIHWRLFDTFQSRGRSVLTSEELESIQPLIEAQENKETQLKTLIEFMADSWTLGWGWAVYLVADIRDELVQEPLDEHYLKALLAIDVACGGAFDIDELKSRAPRLAHSYEARLWALIELPFDQQPSFLSFLLSYTGFSQERKQRWLSRKEWLDPVWSAPRYVTH